MFDPNVTVEFNTTLTSPVWGNIWPTRQIVMRKSKADLFVKQGQAVIVDENALQKEADTQNKKAGFPGIGNKLHGQAAQEDASTAGAPAAAGDPAIETAGADAGGPAKPIGKMNKGDLEVEVERLQPILKAAGHDAIVVPEGATKAALHDLVEAAHNQLAASGTV